MSRVVAGLRSQYHIFSDIEEGNHNAKSLYKDTNFPGIVGIIDVQSLTQKILFLKDFTTGRVATV